MYRLGCGEQPEEKRLCHGSEECSAAIASLSRWIKLADALDVPPVTRTCAQWVEEHARLDSCFRKFRVFRGSGYLRNFTIRALLLASMRCQGVPALKEADKIHTKQFAKAFPDSKHYMLQLQRSGFNSSLADFFKWMKYDGPPELFTMHACLCLGVDMQQIPNGTLSILIR